MTPAGRLEGSSESTRAPFSTTERSFKGCCRKSPWMEIAAEERHMDLFPLNYTYGSLALHSVCVLSSNAGVRALGWSAAVQTNPRAKAI